MTKKADTKPLRDELEKAAAPADVETVFDLLERERPELAKALPKAVSVERFSSTVLTEVRRTPQLLECSAESLLGAVLLAAQLGLEPGPLGLVYLVPNAPAVDFVIGYRGYVDLAYRTGLVRDVTAALVLEGDPFSYRKGTRPYLDHEPQPRDEPRATVAAYAVARLKSGGTVFEVIYQDEWAKAQKASAAGSRGAGPWADEPGAMIRKTAVRRLEPWLPKSALLARAVERDELPAPEPAELTDNAVAL
jgi:recombination protein RecT